MHHPPKIVRLQLRDRHPLRRNMSNLWRSLWCGSNSHVHMPWKALCGGVCSTGPLTTEQKDNPCQQGKDDQQEDRREAIMKDPIKRHLQGSLQVQWQINHIGNDA